AALAVGRDPMEQALSAPAGDVLDRAEIRAVEVTRLQMPVLTLVLGPNHGGLSNGRRDACSEQVGVFLGDGQRLAPMPALVRAQVHPIAARMVRLPGRPYGVPIHRDG